MEHKPLISVIVPAYNAEKTLGACIESLLAQNYADFELIVIDDGSKDRTAAICDDYVSRDSRVKVIHKANGGVGAARNSGLEIAKGKFIAFVDSDDTVTPYYLQNMIGRVVDGVDLVVSNATVFKYGFWHPERYSPVFSENGDCDEIFAKNILHTSPWSKLYRAATIKAHGITFPVDMPIGEDAVFLLNSMAAADKVVVTEDSDYLYNSAEGQLTKKLYSYEKEVAISSQIDNAVDSVAQKKNVRTPLAISRLDRIKSLYRERVLDSIYMSEHFRKDRRMTAIKDLDTNHLRIFSLKECGFRAWLLSHLLKYRMLCTYDFIRNVAAKNKKNEKRPGHS